MCVSVMCIHVYVSVYVYVCIFMSFAYFSAKLLVFYFLNFKCSLFIVDICDMMQIFSPILSIVFG